MPVAPARHGNGLAMRAELLLEGLARAGPVNVLVAPTADAVAAAAAGADLVLAMRVYLAPLLDHLLALPAERRPKLALDVDDIESVTRLEFGETGAAARFGLIEGRYLPRLDAVLTCSAADAAFLADRHALVAIDVIPNAVRPPAGIAAPPAQGTGRDLLFVGNLSYAPNVKAATWLCAEILPRLPDATLALVGSNPSDAVRALEVGRVSLGADVPDVEPFYASSRVAVAPIHAGGGTRIKVLEAYAHGRPVVATPVGVRGIELGAGPGPALVAETPEDFAAGCTHLLADAELAARLGREGAELVAAHGSVDVVAARIEAWAEAMVAG